MKPTDRAIRRVGDIVNPFKISVITVMDVAKREGVHYLTALRWLEQGRIFPAERRGKSWIILDSYVLTFPETHTFKKGRPLGAKDLKPRKRTKRPKQTTAQQTKEKRA